MGIESIIILFGSIGFVLMGLFALYMSTKENKTTKEQQQYIKINGLINIAIGAIGTIIGTISIFFKNFIEFDKTKDTCCNLTDMCLFTF